MPEITPHELRHSCTELWVYNGASQADCGRQLNHSSVKTTERYMHRTDDRLQAIGDTFRLPETSTPAAVSTTIAKPGRPVLRVIKT